MRNLIAAFFVAIMATTAHSAPVQWTVGSGGNDHWYDFVILSAEISATDAETAAEASAFGGSSGYLATITSSAEQLFLNSIWTGVASVSGQFNSYSYFLIGLSDRDVEGTYTWIGGPEEGNALSYTNWSSGEPNDTGSAEDYTVAWWQDSSAGLWNDVGGTAVRAYLVEYDDSQASSIPVPATLPLLAGALVLGGFLNRRRKVT